MKESGRISTKITKQNNTTFLYTKGNEFSLNGVSYVGEYHYNKHGPATYPETNKLEEPLHRIYTNPDHYEYEKIKRYNISIQHRIEPKPYIYTTPHLASYTIGFDNRYFVEKINDIQSYAEEIDMAQASTAGKPGGIDLGLYPISIIKWKLTGTLKDIQQHNTEQVFIASRLTPSIGYAIQNYIQFANITAV